MLGHESVVIVIFILGPSSFTSGTLYFLSSNFTRMLESTREKIEE